MIKLGIRHPRKKERKMKAGRHDDQAHRQRLGDLRCAGLCGVDTTGLAASLPTLPVGLACHGRNSEHVGGNEMSLLTGGILFVGMISKSASSSDIGILNSHHSHQPLAARGQA